MSVIRVNKNNDFTVMSNYHFRDKNLSLKAKGLLSQMLSLPPNWDYTVAGLVAINKENDTAISSALSELKENGYLIITKLMPDKTDSGRIEYVYDIYEHPHEKQALEKQGVENQGLVFQGVENPVQYNTNKSNTDILNTKESNNKYIKNIVDYLNTKAGKNFRANTESTARHIRARLREGFKPDDFYLVIEKKCLEWLGTQWEKYLRPETLFGPKFESYLNESILRQKRGANGVLLDARNNDELDGIL